MGDYLESARLSRESAMLAGVDGFDRQRFIADCSPLVVSDAVEAELLSIVSKSLQEEMPGAAVVAANGYADKLLEEDGARGWAVASLLDPVVFAIRPGLDPGEHVWHLLRLSIGYRGNPGSIPLGGVAVIQSARVPDRRWPAHMADEARVDELAAAALRSMGVSRLFASRYKRKLARR